ncbi:hypothetical protein N7462_004114 [Penicillium macrosclerotiorum]|uniref:uncharacterized protein n=1 Tax=Penicillium macrosclerotiorum TaxID=303699 RepID=UPI0025483F2B|nr:uncharacterized protein N7462_004114 [Penicillium macrosclerotiorum]KAJ5689722.1 hypothetical protein N7462_004114 [Penicillium macrosclerotiorum]
MDQEEAPPPYSAVDPLLAPTNNRNGGATQGAAPLHGNVSASRNTNSSSLAEQSSTSSSPAVVPTHFTSAVTYFEERPPAVLDESRGLLHHHMTIYPRSQAKDFPRRPRCWVSRMDEVAQQDWDTFLRYLFPSQLGLAATSQDLPRQLRAEIQRDRKDRPQETDEQRRARIAAVVDEWNQLFFGPRATRIVFVYVGEPDAAPSSALCPRCYPAATKATQGTGSIGSTDGQAARNSNMPSPVAGQQTPSPNSWHLPPIPHFHQGRPPPGAYGPYAMSPFPTPGTATNHQPPQYYPPRPPPPPGVPPWQWNNWAYSQPQFGNSGTQKSGTLGWISQLTTQAQKYGERFAQQAQQYGDQISAQAMYYGRQVEEQALAHGRWIEEQARLHGRKQAYPQSGYTSSPPATWYQTETGQTSGVIQDTPTPPNTTSTPADSENVDQSQTQTTTQPQNKQDSLPTKSRDDKSPIERSRRASISSTSSESSLSSIDTLSTTSDLTPSDLATVREQLRSLHDRHDRTLYDAAVDLRHQLDVLQESRRDARTSGRRNWRTGWGQQPPSNRADGTDWGRWESPEQQQRQNAERRAMKEEMRATRKAFRDVVRRAREEQRDQHRARRNRRRQARSRQSGDVKANDSAQLDQRLENLSLKDADNAHLLRMQPQRPSTDSELSASSISASASQVGSQGMPAELPERKKPPTRLKEMFQPRNMKKQRQQQQPGNDTRKDPDTKDSKDTTEKDRGSR